MQEQDLELKKARAEDIKASREAVKAHLAQQRASGGTSGPPAALEGLESPPSEPQEGLGWRPVEMLQNAPGSFVRNAKAVLWDLPIAAGESLIHYATRPKEYLQDLSHVKKYLPEIAKIVKDDYADFYDPDHFGAKVTEDPFRVVSDVAGVASIGGGTAAKAGQVASKALRGVSRPLAKAALMAGRAGRGVASVEALDPSSVVLKGLSTGGKALGDAIGVGKYSKIFGSVDATLAGEADTEAFNAAERLYAGKLKPEEHEALIRSFAWADKNELAQLQQGRPDLWALRERMKAWLKEDESYYTEAEKLVTEKAARDSLRRAMVRYAAQKGIKKVDANGLARAFNYDDAIEAVDKLKTHEPVYFKIFQDHDKSLFNAIQDRLNHGGTISRAEQRALKGELPTDIYQILSNQLRTTIGTKKSIKLSRAAQEILAKNGDLRYITNKTTPAEIAALKKAGFAPLNTEFFKKYHETIGKATNMIAEAAKQPGDMITNVANAAEQAKAVLVAAEDAYVTPPTEIWAPRHAVAWLNMRLDPGTSDKLIGKAMRMALSMGGTLPYYKAIATVMNPRYWIANAVGDAALSFLYGIHPQALRYARKLRDLVPDEIRDIGINKLYQTDYNLFMRTANRLQNYANKIDNFFKRAVYINDLVKKGVKDKLLKVGADFFVAEDQLIPFMKEMQRAPNRWVASLEEMTKAKERIAASALGRVKEDKRHDRLGQQFAKASSREGPKGQVMGDDVYSGAKPEGELYPSTVASRPGKIEPTAPDEVYGGQPLPEAAAPEASTLERYNELKQQLKAVMSDQSPGNDIARAQAIDQMVQELSTLGRQLKREAKGVATTSEEVVRVTPESGDFGLGAPSEGKIAGPYDYQAGEARELTARQDRIRKISELIDRNQELRDQKYTDLLYDLNERNRLQVVSPMLARDSAIADGAIEATGRFFGSYARLSPWEKKVVRQFIPFYTFAKAMTQLAFRLPFMMPKRQMIYLNLWRAWNDMIDNDGPNNNFYDSVIPVMALEDGDVIAIKVSSLNPFGSVRTSGMGGIEVPSAFDIFANHPVLRLTMGTRGQVTPKPLQPGITGTRLDNGDVWQYTGSGFKRVLLQPSFARTLWSLFPQSQLIDTMFLSGAQEEGGFALNPKTIKGPDGQPLYPIGWPERIITSIVPATRLNPEKMMRRDMSKLLQIRRSYMKEIRGASPAKREAILTILREMSGDIRRHYLDY